MSSQPDIKWRRGLKFPSLEEGRAALIQHTIDQQQSFRVDKSDHKRFFTRCLSGRGCPYRVRLYVRRDTVQAQVNEYKPEHTCSPDTHVGWVPPTNAQIQPEVNGAESEATSQNEPGTLFFSFFWCFLCCLVAGEYGRTGLPLAPAHVFINRSIASLLILPTFC